MADTYLLGWSTRHETVARREEVQALADASYDLERRSCVEIQSAWRACVVRASTSRVVDATKAIQRIQRGVMARGRAAREVDAKAARREAVMQSLWASEIQRTFRGYYSRRYIHDVAARRAYIQQVISQGEQLRRDVEQRQFDETNSKWKDDQDENKKTFSKAAARLHHLISTKSIPGVYNSPYWIRTVNGVPVEDHLSNGVKDLQTLSSRKKKADLIRWPGPDRRSLQASASPYDTDTASTRLQSKLLRASFIGAKDLVAGQKVQYPPHQKGRSDAPVLPDDSIIHDTQDSVLLLLSGDHPAVTTVLHHTAASPPRPQQKTKKSKPYFHSTVKGASSFDATLKLERDRLRFLTS